MHYSSESWPGGGACTSASRARPLELRPRPVGQHRALVHQRRRRVGGELARAQLLRRAFQAADQLVQGVRRVVHEIGAFSRTSRSTAPSTPLTNAGASAPQNVFALCTASSIAPSGGIARLARRRVGVQDLDQRHPQDAALQRLDALHRPAVRVAVDHLVQLRRPVGRGVRQRARQQRRPRGQRFARAAGR